MATAKKISCWKGYAKQGTKKKGNKTVNNCVKITSKAKSGATIKKAQPGAVMRRLFKPSKVVEKTVDYGKVILTDAQKAKNAEILKNPGSATAKSWSNAKNIAKKETKAKQKASDTKYIEQYNKPMLQRPGSPRIETLRQRAKSINNAKDGKWIQKAINPAHKGYCTPMTKATCTPKRKALAKTLRKISKKK